jgi:DNA-binding NtrC family response regulator
VLVVDRETSVRRSVARALLARGLDVLTAEDADAALALLGTTPVDVVVLDLEHAESVMDRLARETPPVSAVLVVPPGDAQAAERAALSGAFAIVAKPLAPMEPLALAVARAAEQRSLVERAASLERRASTQEDLEELVGTSTRMQELYRVARAVAAVRSPAMIVGEVGTGKDLLARAIHRQGPRASGPLVTADARAIPGSRFAEELFGRGDEPGLLERAHGGTLVLDAIGAVSPEVQAHLARALSDGYFTREGDDEPVPLDARVLATSRDEPRELTSRGELAPELALRLAVLVVRLPPLRQRKDDLPLLVHAFVRRAARRADKDPPRVSAEAMRLLRGRPWPGNVGELEAVIERAVVLSGAEVLGPSDLGLVETPVRGETAAPAFDAALAELAYPEAKQRAGDAFDAFYVAELLERTSGNVSEAARRAGMDRSNFRRLLKKVRAAAKPSRRTGS